MNRLRWVLLCSSAALVVALLAVLAWSWRHPSTFNDYGGWRVGNHDWPAGKTGYVGMTFPDDNVTGSVRIRDVAAHGLRDSTGATLAFFLCTVDPSSGGIGFASESDVRQSCTEIVPAKNATMSLERQQLVIAVTPAKTGILSFSGIDVQYSAGWRNGTQHVGGDTWLRVRG